MLSKIKLTISTLVAVSVCASGCKFLKTGEVNSKPKALSSRDNLNGKVDRVYAAYLKSNEDLLGGPEKKGQDHLYYIGCYGEPQEPNALVPVDSSPGGSDLTSPEEGTTEVNQTVTQIPLSERTTLQEFQSNANPYKCELLIGKENERRIVDVRPEKYMGGDKNGIITNMFTSTAGCLGLGSSSLVLTSSFLPARLKLPGFQTLDKLNKKNFGVTLIGLFAGTVFCTTGTIGLFDKLATYQKDEDQKLFFKYLQSVNDGAMRKLKANPKDHASYVSYAKQGQPRKASAVFIPYFVREFNMYQEATFQQKKEWWQGGKTFFSALKKIESRIDEHAQTAK